MMREIKVKLMYSFTGLLLSGAGVYIILQLISVLLTEQPMVPGTILKLFVAVSGVITLLVAVSCFSLMRREGRRIRNLTGIIWGLSWISGNLICLAISGVCGEKYLWIGLAAELIGCYVDFLLTGMLLMALAAAKHKPAYNKDFVIIPGCSISKQGGLLPLLKGRTNRAIRFAWDQERTAGKPVRYIPTGGQGRDEIMSEGSAMEFYLLSHGAEPYEVFPEKQSVNTYENMLFSKKIIDGMKPGAQVCYATTNYHVLRSGMLARKVGLDAEGLASGTKWYFWPNALAREIIAMFAMYRKWQAAAGVLCLVAAWLAVM